MRLLTPAETLDKNKENQTSTREHVDPSKPNVNLMVTSCQTGQCHRTEAMHF